MALIPALKKNQQGLKCDLNYFEQKYSYIKFVAAEVYRLKKREKYLTTEEKKNLRMMEEDLELHIKDLYEKCGVEITKEQLFKAFEEEPELLEQIAASLSEFKLPAKEEEKK